MSASPSTTAPPAAEEAGAPPAGGNRGKAKRRTPVSRRGERLVGYTFMTPWIIGSLVFTVGPMLWSLYLSFTDYHLLLGGEFIGLARLRTLPFAQRCRPCQEGMERSQAAEARRPAAAVAVAELE